MRIIRTYSGKYANIYAHNELFCIVRTVSVWKKVWKEIINKIKR